MDNFDLRKFLAEGKLFEEAARYSYASCDGDTIELWSKESLNDFVSDMAEDEYSGNKEAAVGYMKNEQMLTKLPSSSYLFIYANDESLDILDASNKEEFVTLINDEFHGELEGDVDAMFAKILSLADGSSISGDSQFQQIVIENGKVVGGAKGELNEAMSAQDTENIAGMVADEFTKESADEGEYLRYSVGRVEGTGFELDTEATDMSSEDLDMRGVGEGWGGNFSVEATEDGHEVRNAEKGGLVAIIDSMGNFKMLSADESRAEMGLKEAKDEVEEVKSTKMKKSELKEMIKAAMLAEAEGDDEDEEDIEVEDEVDVDADVDVDMDIDAGEGGIDVKQDADADLDGSVGAVQDNLEAALEAARALGDEKLEDQIGNTITFFTRAHVVK